MRIGKKIISVCEDSLPCLGHLVQVRIKKQDKTADLISHLNHSDSMAQPAIVQDRDGVDADARGWDGYGCASVFSNTSPGGRTLWKPETASRVTGRDLILL